MRSARQLVSLFGGYVRQLCCVARQTNPASLPFGLQGTSAAAPDANLTRFHHTARPLLLHDHAVARYSHASGGCAAHDPYMQMSTTQKLYIYHNLTRYICSSPHVSQRAEERSDHDAQNVITISERHRHSSVTTMISPAKTVAHPLILEWTPLDLNPQLDAYFAYAYLFKLPSNTSTVYEKFAAKMKESLSQALVAYYPFAGRFFQHRSDFVLGLCCNDHGVQFTETHFPDLELEQLVDLQDLKLVPELTPGLHNKLPIETPPMHIHLTRFKCGGLSLGISFNHMLTDWHSFCQFMRMWSEISLGVQTSIVPDHNRRELKSRILGLLQSPRIKALSSLKKEVENLMKPQSIDFNSSESKIAFKTFSLSKGLLVQLKNKANLTVVNDSEHFQADPLTTMDFLSAILWRCFCRINKKHGDGEDKFLPFLFALQGRERLFNPPISSTYFGNLVMPVILMDVPVEDVLNKPIDVVARIIHEYVRLTKEGSDEAFVSTKVRMMQADNFVKDIQNIPFISNVLKISSITSYQRDTIGLDFGIGKPFFTTWNGYFERHSSREFFIEPKHAISDYVLLLPGASTSKVQAKIYCRQATMDKLIIDPEFVELCS